MDGITILNTIEYGGFQIGAVIALIITACILLVTLYLMIHSFKDGFIGEGVFAIVFAIIIGLIGVKAALSINVPKYNKYQVAVSDEVSFNDFQAQYDILDVNGDIYTVIERGDTDDGNN